MTRVTKTVCSRLLTALILLVGLGSASAEAAAPVGPRTIDRIELRSDIDLPDPDLIWRLIPFEVGDILDSRGIRQTLRNLQASGRVAEAEVWSENIGSELIVRVAFWGTQRVASVGFEGTLELDRRDLERVVEQREGQGLVEGRVLRSVFALQDLYRRQGYERARVRVRVDPTSNPHRVDVRFEVEPGERTLIGRITVLDASGDPDADLARDLPLRVDKPYRSIQANDAAEALVSRLRDEGYSTAEVEFLGATKMSGGTQPVVELRYSVQRGPRYRITVSGWSQKALEKKGLLSTSGLDYRDPATLEILSTRLTNFLQAEGYYRARVTAEYRQRESADDGDGDFGVGVEVISGEKYRVAEIAFAGNGSFERDLLTSFMSTSVYRRLQIGSGRVVDAALDEDLRQVRSYYALSGFLWVRVGPPLVRELPIEEPTAPRWLRIEIPIVEGDRARVVDVQLRGAESERTAELMEGLPLEPGGPYHPQRLDEALDRIRSRYEGWGYESALVTAQTDMSADRTLVDIAIDVQEGTRLRLERVMVRGNQRLATRTVLGVAGLESGEPLSRYRLIEAQQALYRLGVFSRVQVSLAPVGDDPARRDVIIRLTEGDERRVSYGVGYDSDEGARGLFGFSHRNLWGRAIQFQFDLRASERAEDFRLLLSRPFWRLGRLPGSQKLYLSSLDEQRSSFDVEQRGLELELGWDRQRARYSLFFDWRTSDLTLASDVVLEEADLPDGGSGRRLQDIDILSVTPRWVWDGRDDPISPTQGTLLSAQVEVAVPVDGLSTEDFVKVFGQWSRVWSLDGAGALALSLRGGVIDAAGEQPVSIAERFFAGGSTTHRAYARDELGIPGDTLDSRGNPIGGNGMVLANLDWRFPILGDFGGTLFADFGNVWADAADMRPEDAKLGLGIGARYDSPIGPLRLDVAWKLDREPEESPTQVFFAFGYAF